MRVFHNLSRSLFFTLFLRLLVKKNGANNLAINPKLLDETLNVEHHQNNKLAGHKQFGADHIMEII